MVREELKAAELLTLEARAVLAVIMVTLEPMPVDFPWAVLAIMLVTKIRLEAAQEIMSTRLPLAPVEAMLQQTRLEVQEGTHQETPILLEVAQAIPATRTCLLEALVAAVQTACRLAAQPATATMVLRVPTLLVVAAMALAFRAQAATLPTAAMRIIRASTWEEVPQMRAL